MEDLSVHLEVLKSKGGIDQRIETSWTTPIFTSDAFQILGIEGKQQQSSRTPQFALLGGSTDLLKRHLANSSQDIGGCPDPRIFVNVSHPCSIFICGSQGSGKSHTLSCLLENYLIPSKVNNLENPLTGLVFHHDVFISDDGGSPCEAAFLASNPLISVTVFCSPTNLETIKRTYSNLNVEIQPLRIKESDLNTKRMLDLMSIRQEDGPVPLYVQTVTRILRQMRLEQQSSGKPFSYNRFKTRLESADLAPQQRGPLQQRLDALESFMEQKQPLQIPLSRKKVKGSVPAEDPGTKWSSKPGALTIVDLSCPCITSDVACSMFNVCLSIFLEQDPYVGRVVALDEAHKYMDSSAEASSFTESLLSTIRLQRHLGVRVLISTQEPNISPKLLDLSSLIVVHRFTSPRWLNVLQQHIAPVASNMRTIESTNGEQGTTDNESEEPESIDIRGSFKQIFEDIVHLGVGEALLFSPSAVVGVTKGQTESEGLRHLGFGYIKAQIRNRVTDDGGKSILAL